MVLDQLEHLELDADARERLGLDARAWTLCRAWPRSRQLVLLEYTDPAGRTLAGQWHADPAQLDRVCQQTARSGPACLARAGTTRIILQAHGADRRLTGIGPARDRIGPCELLVHRPERRAVVRTTSEPTLYAKITRPGPKTQAAIDTGQLAARIMDQHPRTPPACPRLVHASPDLGVAIWTRVPGVTLHHLLAGSPEMPDRSPERIARTISSLLTHLHATPATADATQHTPSDEAAILRRWHGLLDWVAPDRARAIQPAIQAVCQRLAQLPRCRSMIHRDLHDKQILIDTDGRVGVIDFDTLAAGDPAQDLGNLIAHAQLRVVQGLWRDHIARRFIEALLDPADAGTKARLGVWIQATRLRLACLYSFRPGHAERVFAAFATHPGEPTGHAPLASVPTR